MDEKEPEELDMTNYMTIPYQPITASTAETTDTYLVSLVVLKGISAGKRDTATHFRLSPDDELYSYLSRSTTT